MELTENDRRLLELLEADDIDGFQATLREIKQKGKAEQDQYNAKMDAVIEKARIEQLAPLAPILYPGDYFDITKPIVDQDPRPYLVAIISALNHAFSAGANAMRQLVQGELDRIRREAFKEQDKHND